MFEGKATGGWTEGQSVDSHVNKCRRCGNATHVCH